LEGLLYLPKAARLHRAVCREPKVRLGSVVAPSRELLHMHFPDSGAVEEEVVSVFAGRTTQWTGRWQQRLSPIGELYGQIESFAQYKSSGMDRIFPALLQEGWEVLIPYLVRIFCTYLATGCVPTAWHQVKLVFILKPGKDSYSGPKDYRPISLTSFMLKTTERLLRDEILTSLPLHPNQHAYQTGKSAEMTLHQPVVQI
jgi:hypothetical protein